MTFNIILNGGTEGMDVPYGWHWSVLKNIEYWINDILYMCVNGVRFDRNAKWTTWSGEIKTRLITY